MVDPNIINFVKDKLLRGYNLYQIRSHLINSGYPPNIVDESINYAKNQQYPGYTENTFSQQNIQQGVSQNQLQTSRIEHHISVSPLLFVLLLIIVSISAGAYFYYPEMYKNAFSQKQSLLDFEISIENNNLIPGSDLIILNTFTNMGDNTRNDITVDYKIINYDNKEELTNWQITKAIDTVNKHTLIRKISLDTLPGKYYVEGIINYGKEQVAKARSEPFTIQKNNVLKIKEINDTCKNKIKDNNEEEIDCGGKCQKCIISQEKTQKTCGDGVCDSGELCEKDCKNTKRDDLRKQIQKIIVISKTDSIHAGDLCSDIESKLYKDSCFSSIAIESKNDKFCDNIEDNDNQDICLISIVGDNNNFSLCDKIKNSKTKLSCESMKRAAK